MKPFIAPFSVEHCKIRLADLHRAGWFGLSVKVKYVHIDDHTLDYEVWKTQSNWSSWSSSFDIKLAEVRGRLIVKDGFSTQVSGQFYIGRFYKFLFGVYGLCCVLVLVSNEPGSIFYAIWLLGLMGFGWLLTFYWRNQLEGMIEQKLMGIEMGKKKKGKDFPARHDTDV